MNLFLYDQDKIKNIIDRFMEGRPEIETSDTDLLNGLAIGEIIDYDLLEAQNRSNVSLSRDKDDCIVTGMSSLKINYTPPAPKEAEQRIVREKCAGKDRFRQNRLRGTCHGIIEQLFVF